MHRRMDERGFTDLLDRARSGDEVAFAHVYREVHPRLLRYLKVQAPDRAEDVASETWLQVTRSLARFDGGPAQFRAWVFTIARSKLVDAVRRERKVQLRLVYDTAELEWYATGSAQDFDDPVLATAEEEESTRWAVALIRTLPPDQADVVLLRVLVGLDNAEVAAIVHKSPGAVRVLAHRGLKRLARTLGTEATGPAVAPNEGTAPVEETVMTTTAFLVTP